MFLGLMRRGVQSHFKNFEVRYCESHAGSCARASQRAGTAPQVAPERSRPRKGSCSLIPPRPASLLRRSCGHGCTTPWPALEADLLHLGGTHEHDVQELAAAMTVSSSGSSLGHADPGRALRLAMLDLPRSAEERSAMAHAAARPCPRPVAGALA